MMQIILLSLMTLFQVWSQDFLIPKGSHYSSPMKVDLFRGESLKFKAYFNESAKYIHDDEDQLDVNKLFGTSDCGNLHKENSARFGWRWNKNRLEILGFTHVGGVFSFELIGSAELHRSHNFEISLSDDKSSYIFNFNGMKKTMPRGCQDPQMKGYKLKPYFGGNKSAPHDILIKILENEKRANFSIENLFPNPTKDQNIKLKMFSEEDLSIGFKIYDLNGRLVQMIDPVEYSAGQEYELLITLNSFAAGMYLLYPFDISSGEEIPGFVFNRGKAIKFIVL